MAGQILRTQTFNTAMENATIKHDGQEYNIDRATLERCKVIPKPTYDRMEVLRGEWIPKAALDTRFYSNGGCFVNGASWGATPSMIKDLTTNYDGMVFFPTRELAEEYLTIAGGGWEPKIGDVFWNLSGRFSGHRWSSINYRSLEEPVFPSDKQRDEYIAKHKKVERPLAGKEAIIDGITYKLQ